MAVVKFGNQVKYNSKWYPAGTPITVKDSDLPELLNAGCTVISREEGGTNSNTNATALPTESEPISQGDLEEKPEITRQELATYSLVKLIEFAKERNINLKGKTKKAEIFNIIVANL